MKVVSNLELRENKKEDEKRRVKIGMSLGG